jgi:putative oxidoreductase
MNQFLKVHRTAMRFDSLLHKFGGDIFSFGLRSFVAWQFLKSALSKLDDWQSTISLFQEEYQVPLLSPELAAYAGTGAELVFASLLLFGLFSRLSALGLLLVNIMAVVSYPILWNLECPAALNDHFYWGVLLMSIMIFGVGKLSLDHILARAYR